MLTETTGPALATDRLARSIQALREDACARRGRGGLRGALVPVAAADAVRMAIVALLDALLGLIQELVAQGRAQGCEDVVAVEGAPSPVTVRAGLNALDGAATDRAAPPRERVCAIAALKARRTQRASARGPTHLVLAARMPSRQRSASLPSPAPWQCAQIGHIGLQPARCRRLTQWPGRLPLRA